MTNYLIKEALICNEGKSFHGDLLIKDGRIERVDTSIPSPGFIHQVINASGKYLIPGVIDDQVHFREPGFERKATIASESRAAVAGGVTTFMEMPNTNPQTINRQALEDKFAIADKVSPANYSFYLGATNSNLEEVLRVDKKNVCGVKIFMGSSTGDMLVDDAKVLESIFEKCDHLIATHCESEEIIRANTQLYIEKYGDDIPMEAHPLIRSELACYVSSDHAKTLATKHGTRLHILHISTAKEALAFSNDVPLKSKKITSEACVHHMWFSDKDYEVLGSLIKCNPAIKTENDRDTILKALLDDRIDIIATDHAPHTWDEKQQKYLKAPSGLPLVQHSLLMMLEFVKEQKMSLERLVEKMCHAPADCFRVNERGYIREGYFADLVLIDPSTDYTVRNENILYQCGWSPLKGYEFSNSIESTFVNGILAFDKGKIVDGNHGQRLTFAN